MSKSQVCNCALKCVSVLALATLFAPAPAAADGSMLPMWQVDGRSNTVFLLGSIHMLRASDHPLPRAIDVAYDEAETLVMELDMDDVDPLESQAVVMELSQIEDGRTLADLLGRQRYSRLSKQTGALGLPLEMFDNTEPWFVAITVEQLALMRIGFTPQHGVETHFVSKAAGDGKQILGLETIREQLGFLDGMSISAQRELLMQVLEETDDVEAGMAGLISAWRNGDVAYLEENMLDSIKKQRELYRSIVTDRNRDWVRQIERYLSQRDDYLVIVGTLHLVGDEGVPALLERRGRTVTQMQRP